jgi:hypothetical protein
VPLVLPITVVQPLPDTGIRMWLTVPDATPVATS